jgi:aryl-alcohol dehydrogenase-like predicted oxidoreductase
VVIATKFGFVVDEAGKRVTRFEHDDDVIQDARASCEASLRRLGTIILIYSSSTSGLSRRTSG